MALSRLTTGVQSTAGIAETYTTQCRWGWAGPRTDDPDMSTPDDLIRMCLLPAILPVDVPVDAILRIHNAGDLPCTNLVLEFELPRALTLEQGRRLVERGRLGPDERYDHRIRLRALERGRYTVAILNFSFKDGTGRPRRYHDRIIDIDVLTSDVRLDPSAEPTKASPRRPSSVRPAQLVFISYREVDTGWVADRLVERLRRHFPRQQVFLDRQSLGPGEVFPHRLDAELESSAALLALIGPQWLTVATPTGERRIDADDDFVRHEIAVALRRDILVIPVLLGTTMPAAGELPLDIRALADRNAIKLDRNHFDAGVMEIAFAIRRVLQPPG